MRKIAILFSTLLPLTILIYFYFPSKKREEQRFIHVEYIPDTYHPTTNVEIEGQYYPLLIDLGNPDCFTLHTRFLDSMTKELIGSVTVCNMKNDQIQKKKYRIPQAILGPLHITNAEIIEESDYSLGEGNILYTQQTQEEILDTTLGLIGRQVLTTFNLFLDFQNDLIFFPPNLEYQNRFGYILNTFTPIPFEISDKGGITIMIETDFGEKKFFLDTGSTDSIIRPMMIEEQMMTDSHHGIRTYRSNVFMINNHHFGSIDLMILDIPPVFGDFDAILGMNFFKDHVVYLDFTEKMAYIAKSSECMKDTKKLMAATEKARKNPKELKLRWKNAS